MTLRTRNTPPAATTLRDILSQVQTAADARRTAREMQNAADADALCEMLRDPDETLACRAAWILSHLPAPERALSGERTELLIDVAMRCRHAGLRRISLSLVRRRLRTPRADFLDFCLERTVDRKEAPAVRALCLKLAGESCRTDPDLRRELRTWLEVMEPDALPPSLRTVRRHVAAALGDEKPQRSARHRRQD